ncbi:venom allergen 5-like [Drosophila hydei]|uniref:Venom allergen-1 n=1 Tax=Drosophila hydei TaxID=7224 RepID=A0A6J1LXE3_DROHY|nr:venom allergen 5-like [Drosophila hydei]
MQNIFLIIILGHFLGAFCATDFCKYNCGSNKNIGCNNKAAWSTACPQDKTLITFSAAEKNAIVAKHNEYRNIVARGNEKNLPPACRMATMQWDEDLAYLASLNVKSCAIRHDACRNTKSFQWAGQNLAWVTSNNNIMNANELALKSIGMWYDEIAHVNRATIMAYPLSYNGPTIGHFTVMVSDRNTHVGCAASTYSANGQGFKAFLMACNYATTNIAKIKIYNSCSVPASKCTTGVNPQYKFLCSTKEAINANNLNY